MIVWFIGMSGSGKTTLGKAVYDRIKANHANTVFLDGDEVRAIFAHDQGAAPFTVEGRRKNAERIVGLCEMLDRQDIHVVCCILSLFPDMLKDNRTRFDPYFEVFMDAPMASLQRRDVKGLYAAAAAGKMDNVVGVDIPFPRPVAPDMVMDSSADDPDITRLADDVLYRLKL